MAGKFRVRLAAHHIINGGVVIYPTETLYGIGCNPYCVEAIEAINAIKQRQNKTGFILLASHTEQLSTYTSLNINDIRKLNSTKEPTSWVIPANMHLPEWLKSDDDTIAIRITTHPVAKQLCDILGFPIISTSANISGRKPAKNTLKLHTYFENSVDSILTSDIAGSGQSSLIKRFDDDSILRN